MDNHKVKLLQKKLQKEIYELTRGVQVPLTKFVLDKGYTDPKQISKLWGIDIKTAKKYIMDAKKVTFDKRAVPDIEKIKTDKNVSWLEAVELYYRDLIRPRH